jgi:UDP-glucose 4-epimerase
MTIFGDGEQQRAFTHIDDVAPTIARCVAYPMAANEVFNIGADAPSTVNRLARIVAEALGCPPRIEHLPPRHEVTLAFADHGKLARTFGAQAATPLEDGIRAMARWVKAHGARQGKPFEDIEIMKHLPPSWAARFSTP